MEWDEYHCRNLRQHKHSGNLGCRVRIDLSAEWNDDAARLWRDMHRAAYQACVRVGLRPWLLVRVWELQKRGLLHVHPVLAYSTLEEKRAADRYLQELDRLRGSYGFGYVERKQRVRQPRAAAAYLSSYFVTGKRRKVALQESVQSGQMPHSIIHVSHRLTLKSRVTMRALRLRRFAWVLEKDRSIRDRLGVEVWGNVLIWALAWRAGGNRAPPLPA
jgi:hypothetical protein